MSALSCESSLGALDLSSALGVPRRLAADLHDTVLQPIVSLVVSLEAIECRTPDGADLRSQLAVWTALAREALGALRAVLTDAQTVPPVQAGLFNAIERHIRPQLQHAGIRLHVRHEGQAPELPAEWLSQVYLIVREATTNAERHAHATDITIDLTFADGAIGLSVADNGIGLSLLAQGDEPPHSRGSGLGLSVMRARAQALGGSLTLTSAPSQGTRVVVAAPYPQRVSPGGIRNHATVSIPPVVAPALLSPEA